jgi:hypothetical protein
MGWRMGLPEYVRLRSALLLLRENDIRQLEVAIASSRDEPYGRCLPMTEFALPQCTD